MKRFVLQASPGGGGGVPERFVAHGGGVEEFMGTKLFLKGEDDPDEGVLWLFCAPRRRGGELKAACQVVSRRPNKEEETFATIYLSSQEVRRLAQMGEAQVCLLEFSGDDVEFGEEEDVEEVHDDRKDASSNVEKVKEILDKGSSHGGRQKNVRESDTNEGNMNRVANMTVKRQHTRMDAFVSVGGQRSISNSGDGSEGECSSGMKASSRVGNEKVDTKDTVEHKVSTDLDSSQEEDVSMSSSEDSKTSPSESEDVPMSSSEDSKTPSSESDDGLKQSWDGMDLSSSEGYKSSNSDGFMEIAARNSKTPSAKKFIFGTDQDPNGGFTTSFVRAGDSSIEVSADRPSQKRSHVDVSPRLPNNGPFDETLDTKGATKSSGSTQSSSDGNNGRLEEATAKRTKTTTQASRHLSTPHTSSHPLSEANGLRNSSQSGAASSNFGTNATSKGARSNESMTNLELLRPESDDDGKEAAFEKETYADAVKHGRQPRSVDYGYHSLNDGPIEGAIASHDVAPEDKGIFGKAWSATKSFIGIEPSEPKRKTLKPPKDWYDYDRAGTMISRAVVARNDSDLMGFIDDLESRLGVKEFTVPTLTLAAFVCNQKCSSKTRGLQSSILQCITGMSSSVDLDIYSPRKWFDIPELKPSTVWDDFFSNLVEGRLSCKLEQRGRLFVRVFWIWNDARLFVRKFNSALWQAIRAAVPSRFLSRQADSLAEFLPAERVNTLGGLLQGSFEAFAGFVHDHPCIKEERAVSLHSSAIPHMVDLVEMAFRMNSGAFKSSSAFWDELLSTLSCVRFAKESISEEVIKGVVGVICFRSSGTFAHYDGLVSAIGMDNTHAARVKRCIQDSLCEDLLSTKKRPGIDDVRRMLSSPTGSCISLRQGVDALKRFSSKAMTSSSAFDAKFLFIGDVFAKFVSLGRVMRSRESKKYVVDSINAARTSSSSVEWLQMAFRVAAEEPDIFCCEAERAFLEQVSQRLCSSDECIALLEKPDILHELAIEETPSGVLSLHGCLINRLQDTLASECRDPGSACRLVLAAFSAESSTSARLLSLAVHVFSSSFVSWQPSNIGDLISLSSLSLQLLLKCFGATSRNEESMLPEDCCKMKHCLERVKLLVTKWSKDFDDEALTKACLEQICVANNECWNLVASIADVKLPAVTEMRSKHQEFVHLEGAIVQLLLGAENSSSVPLQSIFNGFSCVVEPESTLRRLLKGYGWLLATEETNEDPVSEFTPSHAMELRHLRKDVGAGMAFSETNSVPLAVCGYFLKTPSSLFQRFLLAGSNGSLSLELLCLATTKAIVAISDLFGPAADFTDIRQAVNTVVVGGSAIEEEVSVLIRCSELELSADATESFLAVSALVNAAEPLKGFIDCCHQFKFLVTSDPSFEELTSIVHELADEAGSVSAQECIGYSERLHSILGNCTAGADHDLVDVRQTLGDHLPILGLLGCFSLHSEVWTFVREMKWFGKAGLKRFYEQYGNVTNVLLGNTASYEMSVLTAVEPTVRVISAAGDFTQEAEVADLLIGLRAHKDIASFFDAGSGTAGVEMVQANLSFIRDSFTMGIDEVAAVHGVFDAVNKTGEYSLQSQERNSGNILSSRVDDSVTPVLTLRYKAKTVKRTLQKGELNSFIQHVGLVQHENSSTEASINALVEQHQILCRAARNVTYMESIGFRHSGKDSFNCMVGEQNVGHANDLLSNSEEALRTCQTWLRLTRSNHFVSLLFWTDELLEIHKAMQHAVDAEDVEAACIAHNLTAMLSGLTCGHRSYQQRLSVVTAAIEVRKNDTFRQDSSWLVDVSMALDSIHDSFNAPWKSALEGCKENSRSQIVLHTMACESDESRLLSLRVLQDIYKDRLPRDFEVFDGLVDCTSEKLLVFLERVTTFRSCTFVIMNIEFLEGSLLEIILSFLSNPVIGTEGIQLHLIQREGSMLHAAPWIDGRRWEPDEYQDNDSQWKALILDEMHVDQVFVVWSPQSGAGKTRYIQQELSERARRADTGTSAKITIHERSSIESLTQALVANFSKDNGTRAVHLNLTSLFESETEGKNTRQVDYLNRFFFSLLVLRSVRDSDSLGHFHLSESNWRIYIEIPNTSGEITADSVSSWLQRNVPILLTCTNFVTPPTRLIIDEDTRRVCTYLRAYDDGTINRKFEPAQHRRVMLVLDKSGSMQVDLGGSSALSVATDNALRIFDSHINVGDEFGVILFNSATDNRIPLQVVLNDNHRLQLRQMLDQVRYGAAGGTRMFGALQQAFTSVSHADRNVETWVVCLTDGASGDSDELFRPWLEQSRENIHLIIVGVNLHPQIETNMQYLCSKYGRHLVEPTKGFFVHSDADISSMNSAFDAVSRSIPVSETFELDGAVTDEQCWTLLDKYVPAFVDRQDMLVMTFWAQFIYRRVKVFDENESFNYNEEHESLGSTLMATMLAEVERLISNNQSRDWIGTDHTQLIYDFTVKDAPEFRLLCSAPDLMDARTRHKLEELDLPGFSIPTNRDLQQRSTLDRYLSQALNLTLDDGRLKCIDDNNFVLTLDFAMKLLSIHERVSCRTPCVIEGETGVSKTALTRMYAILRNSVIDKEAKRVTQQRLDEIAQELVGLGHHVPFGLVPLNRLEDALLEASDTVIGNETDVARDLYKAILSRCADRPRLFQEIPSEYENADDARTTMATSLLKWFSSAALEPTFFDVNVDSSLTEQDFVESFVPIRRAARKLLGSEAIVVVFLDEFNTSSVLGLCKEIIVDHTLAGQSLEDNIVVIAACNPARQQTTIVNSRERDLGKEWAGGHYQVAELPPSLARIKWSFGSLNHDQEKDFIHRRLDIIGHEDDLLPSYLRVALTEFISESQEAMRMYAARNIRDSLVRERGAITSSDEIDRLANVRARSVVSLRDIQRVFSLYDFFSSQLAVKCIAGVPVVQARRNAMLLAVATVYFLRLDSQSREQFLSMTRSLPAEQGEKTDLLDVLNCAMDEVIEETDIPEGVATTRGLKENIFMTFVCTLSKTPLMIVGPPGCSKTLSVNIVEANACGEDSCSRFYREHARLALFHYQCSKSSSSKELLAVFDKASQRQECVDSAKHRCFVLMDEAGLPEEEKESLKVLHYLLEGHMSAKAEVGFVAISNHVLDAAKTNRCVMLLREEPDEEDMLRIARGVLFDVREDACTRTPHVDLDGEIVPGDDFALSLCQSYASLLHDEDKLSWFDTFFGLRDLIHFLKALRMNSSFGTLKMVIALQDIVSAIERNFNGVSSSDIRLITERFLEPLACSKVCWSLDLLEGAFRDPVHVIRDALQTSNGVSSLSTRTRFKLIIDCSGDDSILRLLSLGGIIDLSKRSMFKLSRMPQDVALEQLRLISGVKFAALQGNTVVLSQTESINESFYDLFNQRFQAVTGRDGGIDLYANIAVGGISRRSLVRPDFECVVHVNESDLHEMPAPFLNRFEKFRLTIEDVLHSGWDSLGDLAGVYEQSRQSTLKLFSVLCEGGAIGWSNDKQTLDSLYVDLLPTSLLSTEEAAKPCDETENELEGSIGNDGNLVNSIIGAVRSISSLRATATDVDFVIEAAMKYLRVEDAETLTRMSNYSIDELNAREMARLLRTPTCEMTRVSHICQILVQMLITRVTTRRLLQLATPETMFAARDVIPHDVIEQFFLQEHFSLKALVSGLVDAAASDNETNLSIVYTRTSASIHSIPTHNVSRNVAVEDGAAAERLRHLVHEYLDALIVENLSALKSEAMLSSAVESWAKDSNKSVLILLVDMGDSHACERVNYSRVCVEKNVEGIGGKSFVLLLHYPSSGRKGRSCYPALFLGGWEHFYLDGIGSQDQLLGIEDLIEAACKCQSTGELADRERIISCVADSCLLLLPRVVPHVASQRLFYPSQGDTGQSLFIARSKMLQDVLKTRVGDSDIATILCRKFAAMWAEQGLLKSMRTATKGLALGTTQLSLTMSIQTALVETFDGFLTTMFMEMNDWRNLDILLEPSTTARTCELFGILLNEIPIMPFEELVLQTKKHAVQVSPVVDPRNESANVYFPFFRLVSSFIDQCIDLVEQRIAQEHSMDSPDSDLVCPRDEELFLKTVELIQAVASGDPELVTQSAGMAGRVKPVVAAIAFVQEECNPCGRSLFDLYLKHTIEWRLGCDADPFIEDQITREVATYGNSQNIVAIHVVTKTKSKDLRAAASFQKHVLTSGQKVASGMNDADETRVELSSSAGEEVFKRRLEHFEATSISGGVPSDQWSTSFSVFVHQIPAMLAGKPIEDRRSACRLRMLSFFHVLIEASAATRSQQAAAHVRKEWDSLSDDELVASLSLENLLSGSCATDELVLKLGLRHFLSPAWTKATKVFRDADFAFLLNAIIDGALDGPPQLLETLLVRACFQTSYSQMPTLAEVLTSSSLAELGPMLSCEQISMFSSDGKRVRIPHYVPGWLLRGGREEAQESPRVAEFDVFLANYVQCFRCRLSAVCFGVLLRIHLREAEGQSSESLFIALLHCVHGEVSIQRQEHTRRSRSRKAGDEQLVAGSPLGAIALDVRLLCFVAKVAHEISVEDRAVVFSGVHADEATALFEAVMSMSHVKWQELFFSVILRVGGEGTLASALAHGQLNQMDWCQKWCQALPSQMEAVTQSLKEAEDALAEALDEEDRKTRELRLCPNCRQPFGVLERNCGTFVCGRDFHGGQGQAGHGCGQTFQLDAAQPYTHDESLLAPLRATVAAEQAKFREHEHAVSLWDAAIEMQVPVVSFSVERRVSQRSLLPCSSFLSAGDTEVDSDVVPLVEVLLTGSRRAPHFSLLPDLIEFYVWLHTTFRYLVTREKAFHLKLSDVMKQALLHRRFDPVLVNHITALWGRVAIGINEYLREQDHKIVWECEEIHITFDRVENAPLLTMLSEGDHPTDGNDVLFLIINEIIGEYNSFARRLVGCVSSDDTIQLQEVHPKFVATGCGGAIALSASMPLSPFDLEMLVASYWKSEECVYDLEGLNAALRKEIGLHGSPPVILNPSQCLRERFRFRDDISCQSEETGMNSIVSVNEEGEYFANHQDYRVVEDCFERLREFELSVGDASVRRTLSDNLYTFDYNQLRLMVEGCRSLLSAVSAEYLDFVSVDRALRDTSSGIASSYSAIEVLSSFGFPELSSSQGQLLSSLDSAQFVELVKFLSYQLASESHLFASLPMCMTDPVKDDDLAQIDSSLEHLCEDHGKTRTVEYIEEFTRDVLGFYESPIREEAVSNRCSLKTFLLDQSFCDDSDVIFALLPMRVTLHNYISLRQHLHQRKLALLSSEPRTTTNALSRNIDSKTVELFTRPSRGRFWLWEDDSMNDQETLDKEDEPRSAPYNENWSLWFESRGSDDDSEDMSDVEKDQDACVSPRDEDVAMTKDAVMDDVSSVASDDARSMDIDECPDPSVETEEDRTSALSAVILQRWWRRQLSQFDRGGALSEDDDYEDMFDVVDDDDEDMLDSHGNEHHPDAEAVLQDSAAGVENPPPLAASVEEGEEGLEESNATQRAAVPVTVGGDSSQGTHGAPNSQSELSDLPSQPQTTAPAAVSAQAGGSSQQQTLALEYGNAQQEADMRTWLNDNRLPQSVADELLELGARNIIDVVELVESCPEMLQETNLKPLDRVKLIKAASAHRDENA